MVRVASFSRILCQRNGLYRHMSFSLPTPRTLAQIASVEKLSSEDAENIHAIWLTYHEDKSGCLGSTVSQNVHNLIMSRAKKRNPGSAQPWYSLNFYPDLLQSKGLGLLRCDFLPNLLKEDARALTDMIVRSYTEDAVLEQVTTFNHHPENFDVDKCLDTFRGTHPTI